MPKSKRHWCRNSQIIQEKHERKNSQKENYQKIAVTILFKKCLNNFQHVSWKPRVTTSEKFADEIDKIIAKVPRQYSKQFPNEFAIKWLIDVFKGFFKKKSEWEPKEIAKEIP